jgi:predicted PurR-regulated permease PerM
MPAYLLSLINSREPPRKMNAPERQSGYRHGQAQPVEAEAGPEADRPLDTYPARAALSGRSGYDIASVLAAVIALYAVLQLDLLSALIAGLLIAQLVHLTVPLLNRLGVRGHLAAKALALAIVAVGLSVAIALAALAIWRLTAGPENLVLLLQRIAEVIETARNHSPDWAKEYLPASIQELELAASKWLRENAWQFSFVGRGLAMFLVHTIIGMVIGGMIAFTQGGGRSRELGPLAAALEQRALILGDAFRRVVFSQIRISAINTVLTGLYLSVILPFFGIELPFVKTMIGITFFVGLLPVVGNLISNTVIVLVSFSSSPVIAVVSLVFLVVIHKLEYFLNARIIGGRIRARAWELLVAMLVLDAWFGIPGLIAAPIYYAYGKEELSKRGLI